MRILLVLPFLMIPSISYADELFSPKPFVGVTASAGDTKVQISRKQVDHIHLQSYGIQAGLKWKYVRATANYDWLSSKLANAELVTGNIAVQYPIGRITPFVGVGGGYMHNKRQGNVPVYVGTLGAEYSIDENISIEAKYRYIHPVQHSAKPAHLVGVGLNFRF